MRLIDADELLNKTANLEAVALEQVAKYEPSENPREWHRWTGILQERTAFKYDLMDAPTIDAEPIKHGEWLMDDESGDIKCSCCGHWSFDTYDEPFVIDGHKGIATVMPHYCGYCGAKMDEVST